MHGSSSKSGSSSACSKFSIAASDAVAISSSDGSVASGFFLTGRALADAGAVAAVAAACGLSAGGLASAGGCLAVGFRCAILRGFSEKISADLLMTSLISALSQMLFSDAS